RFVATLRSRGGATVAGSEGSPLPTVTVVAGLLWPVVSVTTRDSVSPPCAAIWRVKLPFACTVAVAVCLVRVLVSVTVVPAVPAPVAPVTVTNPLVIPLSVSWPAFRGGGGGAVAVTVTVTGALSRVPSLTMSWATYVPALSTTNVGCTVVGSDSVAALPAGTTVKAQRKVRGSPSTSLDWLPSSVTVVPTKIV